jgi:hypothetical protein
MSEAVGLTGACHFELSDSGVVEYYRSGLYDFHVHVQTSSDSETLSSPMMWRMMEHIGGYIHVVAAHYFMGRPAGHFMGSDMLYVIIPEVVAPNQVITNVDSIAPCAIFPFSFGSDVHSWEIGTSPMIVFTFNDSPADVSTLHVNLFRYNMIFHNFTRMSISEGGFTMNLRMSIYVHFLTWQPGYPSIEGLEALVNVEPSEITVESMNVLTPSGLDGPVRKLDQLAIDFHDYIETRDRIVQGLYAQALSAARLAISTYRAYLNLPSVSVNDRLFHAYVGVEVKKELAKVRSLMCERKRLIDSYNAMEAESESSF